MANGEGIIRRIIRLVLDDRSAKQTQDEASGVAENVEKAWKSAAAKIAGYLGVAFLTKKVVDFGRAAIAAAAEEEAAINQLRVAVENAGGSWSQMEAGITAAAAAMQAATTIGDDQYYASLQRLIDLTGDVSASTNNMGLVANVAAQFFNGELGPAADLVGKVMNGNVTILQRMGIQAGSAQEALELLSTRAMGAAEARAQTFGGQVAQLNNLWGDFQEQVGYALTAGEGGVTLFTVLRSVIATLSEWVSNNTDNIQRWVRGGINFAIDAADVLLRAIMGMTNVIRGGFTAGLGVGAQALALLARGYATAYEAAGKFLELIGAKDTGQGLQDTAAWIREQAKAVEEWSDRMVEAGGRRVEAGIERLSNPMFSSAQFQTTPGGSRPRTPTVGAQGPQTAAGMQTEAQKNLEKAMDDFVKAGERIDVMQSVLGDKFNAIDAEIKRTTDLLTAMVTNGVDPADESFLALQRTLTFLTQETDPLNATLAAMGQRLREDAAIAAMTGVESFDMLRGQQAELEKAMRSLIQQGMDPQDERLQALAERYAQVTTQIENQTTAMQFQAGMANFLGQAIGASMEGGIGPAAAAKAKQNKIEAAEMAVRALGFALFGNLPAAAGALKLAASHAGLAVAWSALAGSSRKGGGSVTTPPTAAAGGAGGGITTARGTSSRSTTQSRTPSPEVSIYMVGPGFDAVNPTVQRVVWGAQQNAQERYGNNATVRTVRQ